MPRVTVKSLQKQLEEARRQRDDYRAQLKSIGAMIWSLIKDEVDAELDGFRSDLDGKADENHSHEIS